METKPLPRRNLFVVTLFPSYSEYEERCSKFVKALTTFYKIYGVGMEPVLCSCKEACSQPNFHTKVVGLAEVLKKSDIVVIDQECLDHEEENYGCVLLKMVADDMEMPYVTIKLPNIIVDYNLPDLDITKKLDTEPEEIPVEVVESKEMLEYGWTERIAGYELWKARQ